jgi:hypothetical protein
MRKIIKNKVQEEYTGWMLVETGGQRLKAPSVKPVECPLDRWPKKFESIEE